MAPTQGVLYVTMQPKPGLELSRFHDWYNNEHGPNRLRLPFFENGYRYKAVDELTPEWMAMYDVNDMSYLEQDIYTKLRKPPVQTDREREVMREITVVRRFYDLAEPDQTPPSNPDADAQLLAVSISSTDQDSTQAQESQLVRSIPGWKRSRSFKTSSLETSRPFQTVYIHEFELTDDPTGNSLLQVGEDIKSTIKPITADGRSIRLYRRFYSFGPAPRDRASPGHNFTFPDPFSKVLTKQAAGFTSLESYVTTQDGAILPYKLDGNPDFESPTIVLINSILVDWGIWDGFIREFYKYTENQKYQILRFNARGRLADTGPGNVTVDTLASDAIHLLDCLKIKTATAVIGVSLGGATTLNVALKYPNRVGCFVSCDTNAIAPPSNPKAWNERIEVAEREGMLDGHGVPIVGQNLAEMTVRRWFTAESYDETKQREKIALVKNMVQTNPLEGFKGAVKALYEYDFRGEMKTAKVGGMFLVGSSDGVLPKTMKEMASSYGDGTSPFVQIENAGHLPMVEQPVQFAKEITSFVQKK